MEEYIAYEEITSFMSKKKFQITEITRKSKWIPFKKRQSRNMKKNIVKINGYQDKLFALEQELPELFDESQIVFDYDDDYCSYCGCSICNAW